MSLDPRNVAFSIQCTLVRDYIHLNSFAYDQAVRVTAQLLSQPRLPSDTFNLVAIFTHFHAAFTVHPGYARCAVLRAVVSAADVAARLGPDVTLDEALMHRQHCQDGSPWVVLRQGNGHRLMAATLQLDAARDLLVLLMPDLAADDAPGALSMHVLVLDRARQFPLKTLQPAQRRTAAPTLHAATATGRALAVADPPRDRRDAVQAARTLVLCMLGGAAPVVTRERLWVRLRSAADQFGARLSGPEFAALLGLVEGRDAAALDGTLVPLLNASETQWSMVLDGLLARDRMARVVAADLADLPRPIAQPGPRFAHLVLFHEQAPRVAVHAFYAAREHRIRVSLLRCGGDSPDVDRQSRAAEAALMRKLVHHFTNLLWRSVSV